MSTSASIHGCDWDDHLRCAMPFIEQASLCSSIASGGESGRLPPRNSL